MARRHCLRGADAGALSLVALGVASDHTHHCPVPTRGCRLSSAWLGRGVRVRDAWMRNWAAGLDFEIPAFGRDRLAWRRASGAGEVAVEVVSLAGVGVALRQGGWPDGPALLFSMAEWRAFLAGVDDGEFNDLTDTGRSDEQQ